MPTNIRDVLPRVEILRQDRLPGKYPTVARTGDSNRRGNNPVFFDDTKTIAFIGGVNVSFPTTFHSTSNNLENDLKSGINVSSGSVTKLGTEQFATNTFCTESFKPFVESNINQDIKTENYYLTGSGVSDVGLGFSSNLGSKTVIKIPIEISSGTVFLSTSVDEVFYYNRVLRRFEKRNFNAVPHPTINPGSNRPFGSYFFDLTFHASPLFNAFGVPQSDFYAESAGASVFTTFGASAGPILEFNGSSILTSASNAATSSQILDISSFIHAPFLLEKVSLELPFSASTGWYNSPTAHSVLDGEFDLVADQSVVGGPAVTFALLNQLDATHRDLICSGSILPERDCTPWFEKHTGTNNTVLYRTLNGFTSFSTPSFKVPAANFNGLARLLMDAAQTHGFITESLNGGAVTVAPWGRAQNGFSGRSLFGGDYIATSRISVNSLWRTSDVDPLVSSSNKIGNSLASKFSPYLIYPKDSLIAYLSIGHPGMRNVDSANPALGWTPTASHAHAGIPQGVAFLTLFGSFVKEDTEFHDTLNQRLETNELHEIVGNDPVLDQFDVVSNFELTGSILDRFSVERTVPYLFYGSSNKVSSSFETQRVFSSYIEQNPASRWSTQFQWTSASLISTLKKSSKNTTLMSDEMFWDTRVPDPNQVFRKYNASGVRLAGGDASLPESSIGGVVTSGRVIYTHTASELSVTGESQIGDWVMTYPFEPKFSEVSTTFSNLLKGDFFNQNLGGATKYQFLNTDSISIEFGRPGRRKFASEIDSLGSPQTQGVGLPEFIKFFYGIGDGNSPIDNNHVEFTNLASNGVRTRACLRGWKYGLYSGFPTVNKAVWRRDRFGQPRDMLEQRLDTKFYIPANVQGDGENKVQGILTSPVSVKFVDSAGVATRPEYTYSSNLSNEATSSMPYFDGDVRNRENPISLAQTNQSIVVI